MTPFVTRSPAASPRPPAAPETGSAPGRGARTVDAAPANAVSVRGLNKIYAGKTPKHALIDVDLDIPRGSLFGLLGPNGAGKSTLINILAQLVNKTSGTVRIWDLDLDRDPRSAAAAIGVVPQELNRTEEHTSELQSLMR